MKLFYTIILANPWDKYDFIRCGMYDDWKILGKEDFYEALLHCVVSLDFGLSRWKNYLSLQDKGTVGYSSIESIVDSITKDDRIGYTVLFENEENDKWHDYGIEMQVGKQIKPTKEDYELSSKEYQKMQAGHYVWWISLTELIVDHNL